MHEYYDKDEIKNSLTIDEVFNLVAEFGGEPIMKGEGLFTAKTICHNNFGEGSHKLYYYDNTKLFKCYTDCGTSFDIFELVAKIKNHNNEVIFFQTREGLAARAWELYDAVDYVAKYFNKTPKNENFSNLQPKLNDWKIFEKYEQIDIKNDNKKRVELKKYDNTFLKHLPQPRIIPWEKEGITDEVMKQHNIAFNPSSNGIVIPHYDINNNLVGIRERTLIKDNERYGKYRPSILNGVMFNHPLGFNLYNLNNSKDNIKKLEKVFVFEGEKSPLLYASYFGADNDISVATCGFNLLSYQVELLISCGAKEIIIAFDKQFQEQGDAEWEKLVKKLYNIHDKYGSYVQISYLFDKQNLLDYKDSPIDKGKDIFLQLFKERVII